MDAAHLMQEPVIMPGVDLVPLLIRLAAMYATPAVVADLTEYIRRRTCINLKTARGWELLPCRSRKKWIALVSPPAASTRATLVVAVVVVVKPANMNLGGA